jgi:two-component sensor histidine kinase
MRGGEPPDDGRFSLRVRAELDALVVAREALRRMLTVHRASRRVHQEADLVLHELVINGVVHGGPGGGVGTLEIHGRVEGDLVVLQVHDEGSAGEVAPKQLTEDAESGRGLALVAGLSESWAVDRSQGTSVTAWLSLA